MIFSGMLKTLKDRRLKSSKRLKTKRVQSTITVESGEGSENESDMSCTDHSNGDDAEALLIGAKTSKQDNAGNVKDHSDPSLVKVFDELDQEYDNSVTGPSVEEQVAKTINK